MTPTPNQSKSSELRPTNGDGNEDLPPTIENTVNLSDLEEGRRDVDKSNSLPDAPPALEQRISQCPNDAKHPISVLAKMRIKVGAEEGFGQWIRDITETQTKSYAGYLGSEVIRPMNCDHEREYIAIFRYDTYDHLKAWMTSATRRTYMERVQKYLEEPLLVTYHSLQHWFVRPSSNEGNDEGDTDEAKKAASAQGGPPAPYKMVVVVFLVIWFQVHYIAPITVGKVDAFSPLAKEALGTLIIVILTTYIFMPIVTRLLAFWLFPGCNYLETLKELVPKFLIEEKAAPTNEETEKQKDITERTSRQNLDKTENTETMKSIQ